MEAAENKNMMMGSVAMNTATTKNTWKCLLVGDH
jgi:hypothetical protein